jgi:DNA-binding CsgD family transcriptional regulator
MNSLTGIRRAFARRVDLRLSICNAGLQWPACDRCGSFGAAAAELQLANGGEALRDTSGNGGTYMYSGDINNVLLGLKNERLIEALVNLQFRGRQMQPDDVTECARMVAEHPIIGPRYGEAIRDLELAWRRMLESDGRAACLLEEISGSEPILCFVGVSVFVGNEFLEELKKPPLQWTGPMLAAELARGKSPLLSARQIRDRNSGEGLNSLVWESYIRPGYEHHAEIHRKSLEMFLGEHRGYLWNESISAQFEQAELVQWALAAGGKLWDPAGGRYVESSKKDLKEFISEPFLLGVTREMEKSRPGSWIGTLFDYRPPQVGLSLSEQRLILSALSGSTDKELSEELSVSISTVKNTWRSIFNRVESRLPALFSNHSDTAATSGRGKERRRRLLAYLREHPEELRPISRKLLERAQSAAKFSSANPA